MRIVDDSSRSTRSLPSFQAISRIQSLESPGESQGGVFEKSVWSVEDVARELSISVRQVYRLISSDQIPYAKVGRLVRFSPARISEWLQKGGTR